MYKIVVLSMFFMHIVDDYYLQGVLAKLKQKSWWIKQPEYKPLYKHDYMIALFEHAFSWAFCIHIPLIAYILYCHGVNFDWGYVVCTILINTLFHAMIDDVKANERQINLITDQFLHFVQIIGTAIALYSQI